MKTITKQFSLYGIASWLALITGAELFALEPSGEGHKIEVTVSIPPQAYFVEKIGGELVDVNVMVGPGQSPHTYEPTPRQITKLAKSSLFFTIGMPYEKAIIKKVVNFSQVRVVDSNQGLKLRLFSGSEIAGHEEHAGEPDPHTWLNPKNAKIQARTYTEALIGLSQDTAANEILRRNLSDLEKQLDSLDMHLAQALAPFRGREFYVYHPAFGYFADAYFLRQVPIETEGKEPGAKQLAELIDKARHDNIKIIFVQPEISSKGAAAIAEAINGVVINLDHLAKDYIKNLEATAIAIRQSLQKQDTGP